MLSPVGDVFFEAYRVKTAALETVPVFLSEKARRSLETAVPDEKKLFHNVLRKVRNPMLRHSGSEQKHRSDCFVYPKGHRDERVFYYEDENGVVYICELARHSDQTYERLLDRGVMRHQYEGFKPMTTF